jgi:epoxyqueuosine reductase
MGASIPASALAELALEAGFDDVAAAPATPVPADPERLRAVLPAYPPELAYLQRRLADRLDPSRLLPGLRSVVVACLSYASDRPGLEARPPGAGFVSRFAWGPDYHGPAGEAVARLAAALEAATGEPAKGYADTGPVLEKAWAAAAGLGFVGRHGLLVHPRLGSFVFLAVVLTGAEVVQDRPRPPLPGCGFCTACLAACPTGALPEPRRLDVPRCLAHVTVTARTPPPAGLPLAGHLYGCDRCQDACPFNHRAPRFDREAFRPLPGLPFVDLDDVLAMDEAAFGARFGRTPAARRGLAGLQQVARALREQGA